MSVNSQREYHYTRMLLLPLAYPPLGCSRRDAAGRLELPSLLVALYFRSNNERLGEEIREGNNQIAVKLVYCPPTSLIISNECRAKIKK